MNLLVCFYRLFVSVSQARKALKATTLAILFIFAVSVSEAMVSDYKGKPILPPVAICKNISVQLGATGTVSITGSDVNNGSYDPDGNITNLAVTPSTFNCSQIGPNSVTLTVTDNEGLTSTCIATVTVEDHTPPVMICRNHTVYLDASGTVTISPADLDNGSSDNCGAGLIIYLSRTSFNCSDVGTPVAVTVIGTDASGNSSSCISQITVLDTISPVINVKPLEVVLGSSGTATIVPSDLDNGTFDNCGPVTLTVSPGVVSCSDLGKRTVTLTATDAHGNSSSLNSVISVSTTLSIAGMSLSSCDLSPTLALFEADTEGGDGSYSYLWKGLNPSSQPFMVIIPFPPSLQFSNISILESPFFNNTMANGFYDIRLIVTDGKGCADSSEITINKTGAVFNNQTMRNSEACEGEIKTYSVNYKTDAVYSWSVTNGTILTANPDTSRISVRWNLGVVQGRILTTIREPNILFTGGQCESTVVDTVTITPIPTPVFNNPSIIACSGSVITYTLTGTYAYQGWTITGGVITSGGRITDNYVTVRWGNGPAGNISVSVGNNSLCTGSVVLNVIVRNLSGAITSLADITCNGSSDGSITVAAATGTGTAPYSYSLDGGAFQAGGTFTGISLGNHFVRIRDAMLCTFDLPFVINQPAPVLGVVSVQTDVNCFGGTDGSVTISSSGGVAPYQYSINGGTLQSSNVFNGLSAGSYIITISDSHGCTDNVPCTIKQPAMPLNGSASVTNITCYGESTGRIDISVTGGTAPYAFLWNTGATSEDITNIPSGNYSVVITDASGCTTTVPAIVTQPPSGLSGSVMVTNVQCFGGITGSVDLTVTGGTLPYSYIWNNGALTEDLINVPAGSYSVIITDVNGCSTTLTTSVTEPSSAVNGSVVSTKNVSCTGGNDGSISVIGNGGIGPYEYQLGTGAFQSAGIFGSLTAGMYIITIRDVNLCLFSLQITITEPSVPLTGTIIVTNINCFGESTGACDLTVAGGTSPLTYLWNNGAVTEDINNLLSGNYSVTVTDSFGCTAIVNALVDQPAAALTGNITSQTNVSAYGGNDGSVTISGSGGTQPYQYNLDGGSYQSSGTFSSLSAGNYIIGIRDINMCTSSIAVIITQPWIPLTANITAHNDVLCHGSENGSVTIAGWGGTLPYEYSIDGGAFQPSGTFNFLGAGTYTVTVRDVALDIFNIIFTITEPDVLDVAVSGEDVHCYGGSTGSVTAIATGGTGPYTYEWNSVPVQLTPTAINLTAGTYSVTVTDENGCTSTNDVTISQPAVDMTISITHEDILCAGGNTGSATAVVTGGLAPYTYLWNSNPEQTKDVATDLTAGTYNVTVTDSYGCIRTSSVSITEPQAVSVDWAVADASCPDSNDGSINLTISGGTSPYIVIWSDGVTTQNRSGLAPGTYNAVVTDKNSCAASFAVEVGSSRTFNCLVIPQIITPNNDGFNDEWRIKNIDLYPDAEVRIYNRWGQLVYGTRNLADNPWDGRSEGKLVPTDSYHYVLYLNDGSEPRSGIISVIR
jgi:gliding motility-associated-like protein